MWSALNFTTINHRQSRLLALAAVASLTVLVLALASCGSPKRALQFRIYPEDSFIVYETSKRDITLQLADRPVQTLMGKTTLAYKFDVQNIDDQGVALFDVTVQEAKYSLFDRPLGPALEGKSFSVRINPDGSVAELLGADQFRSNVDADLDYDDFKPRPRNIEQHRESALIYVSADALRMNIESIFRVWPATPVSPGDSWSREPLFSPVDGVTESTNYTVASWKGGEVDLNFTSILSDAGSHKRLALSGTATGTVHIDAISGFVKTIAVETMLDGTVTREGQEPEPVTIREERFIEFLRL